LFYWNLLSYERAKSICSRKSCFNPCFTGTSSHTGIPVYSANLLIMFQSLFYWNLLSYQKAIQALEAEYESFNPCFTGTSSHTKSYSGTWGWVWEFQSLFYWNLLSYLEKSYTSAFSKIGFNPCFTGTSSHTCLSIWLRPSVLQVSILVLLEPPLIL